MGKILGLDYGERNTGISITDDDNIFAFGLYSISTNKLILIIKKLFFSEKIEGIIIGYPIQLNNKQFSVENKIKHFIRKITMKYPSIYIKRVDERFTSKMAMNIMINLGIKKKKEIK